MLCILRAVQYYTFPPTHLSQQVIHHLTEERRRRKHEEGMAVPFFPVRISVAHSFLVFYLNFLLYLSLIHLFSLYTTPSSFTHIVVCPQLQAAGANAKHAGEKLLRLKELWDREVLRQAWKLFPQVSRLLGDREVFRCNIPSPSNQIQTQP